MQTKRHALPSVRAYKQATGRGDTALICIGSFFRDRRRSGHAVMAIPNIVTGREKVTRQVQAPTKDAREEHNRRRCASPSTYRAAILTVHADRWLERMSVSVQEYM
jgi:hypothetical protein